jgi:hypothetical protein
LKIAGGWRWPTTIYNKWIKGKKACALIFLLFNLIFISLVEILFLNRSFPMVGHDY